MKRIFRPFGGFLPVISLFALFTLYTVLIQSVDVKPIGPNGSVVGFATLNGWVHDLFGVHWTLYTVTDWLGLVPVLIAFGFTLLGLAQLIRRKSLIRVDGSILVLGGFYVLVIAAYLFFESHRVNYRPVLIDGFLETSYPSSTTMSVLCVMTTAMMQLQRLVRNRAARHAICGLFTVFTVFMVAGRLLSGVHWLTDILGGVLLSAALVLLYRTVDLYVAAALSATDLRPYNTAPRMEDARSPVSRFHRDHFTTPRPGTERRTKHQRENEEGCTE